MAALSVRSIVFCLCLAVAPGTLMGQAPPPPSGTAPTTVVVVRHAEKALDDPRDPVLTAAGEQRARALLEVVANADVAAIYSTQFRRTRATVEPLAQQLRLPVVVREIAAGSVDAYAEALAREILTTHAGQSVVVVGHSNTVPGIVRALSGHGVAEITDDEYQHLFVVVVPAEGAARVFKTRYGAADPR
jgi:broad specificity phosphatase PhoE